MPQITCLREGLATSAELRALQAIIARCCAYSVPHVLGSLSLSALRSYAFPEYSDFETAMPLYERALPGCILRQQLSFWYCQHPTTSYHVNPDAFQRTAEIFVMVVILSFVPYVRSTTTRIYHPGVVYVVKDSAIWKKFVA